MKHQAWLAISILFLSLLVTPLGIALADDGEQSVILRGNYILKSGEQRSSDLTVVGGNVELQGQSLVKGNVVIVGGEAAIDGAVDGDIVAWGAQVSLGETAIVGGDVVVFGTVRRHANATVRGTIVEGLRLEGVSEYLAKIWPGLPLGAPVAPPARPGASSPNTGYTAGSLATLLLILGVAALVITLLPAQVERVGQTMSKHALFSLGVGGLTMVLVLILLPILIVLCLGIPLAIVLAIAFVLCGLLGWVAAGKLAGRRVVHVLGSRRRSLLGETVLGTLAITLLSMVPCVGFLLALGIACWGVGGAVLTRLGTSDYPPDITWAGQPRPAERPTAPPATQPEEGSSGDRRRDTRPLSEAEIWGP